MILCVTPNTAVDRTLIVPAFQVGDVARATETIVAAGGKGVNVARAAQRLGGTAVVMGFLGGYSGQLVAHLAQEEGLRTAWTWVETETRKSINFGMVHLANILLYTFMKTTGKKEIRESLF